MTGVRSRAAEGPSMTGGGGAVGVGKDGHHCDWPVDEEWQALRQRGASAGWLADASEVRHPQRVYVACWHCGNSTWEELIFADWDGQRI